MSSSPRAGLAALTAGAVLSPFTLTRRLLGDIPSGHERPIDMTIGEPREKMPDFIQAKLAEAAASLAKYPPIRGSDELRQSIATWLNRRYALKGQFAPQSGILPVNGSREGLFFATFPAVGRKNSAEAPAVLMPNPYYVAYVGAALAANADPVYLPATRPLGHLPDLQALAANEPLLRRTAAMFLCNPANPQGVVASRGYLETAITLARRYDFILFCDECYSEIYTTSPPLGALAVADAMNQGDYRNLVVFNSLSKRSNLPGLRSGFIAGDPDFVERLAEIRNMVAPQMPGMVQHASAAAWADENHTEPIRAAYREKFAIADECLSGWPHYRRPAGGFLLWLDASHLGGSENATVTLWKRYGVKVLPGAYLSQPGEDGSSPGEAYIRVALVHDPETTREALERISCIA